MKKILLSAVAAMAVPIQNDQICAAIPIPVDNCKLACATDATNKNALDAVKTLKALGGIDGCMLDKLDLEQKQCCYQGTPIGDRLLKVADRLAQTD